MNVSSVAICNQAMSWLGANLITNLELDESDEAKACNAIFDLTRDAVMEAREWTFAVERFSLPKMSREPAYGYGSQFLIPNNVLRMLSIPSVTSTGGTIQLDGSGADWTPDVEWWRIEHQPEGRVILVNRDGPLFVRALVRVVESFTWSPTFIQAFSARIAADLAMALTEDRQKMEDMYKLYASKLGEAASMDGMQGRAERIRSDHLTRVR